MKRLLLVICLTWYPAMVLAQSAPYGLTSATLGGAGSALPGDPWASLNPASLAALDRSTAAMYFTQAFGMPELRLGAGVLALPVRSVWISVAASTFGDSDFRESELSLSAATRLIAETELLNIGLSTIVRQVSIAEHQTARLLHVSIGWQAEAMPRVLVGGAINNITGSGWNDIDITPRRMNVGVAYSPSEDVTVVADILKYDNWPMAAGGGLELRLVPAFAIRAGAASGPDRLTLGARITVTGITAEVLAERHVDLGWSPGVGVATAW